MQSKRGFFITRHNTALQSTCGTSCSSKTIIPQEMECRLNPGEWADPLGEEAHRTTPHLIHTYPDKVLFLA